MSLIWRRRVVGGPAPFLTGTYYRWACSEAAASFADSGVNPDLAPLVPSGTAGTNYSLAQTGLFGSTNAVKFLGGGAAWTASTLTVNAASGISMIFCTKNYDITLGRMFGITLSTISGGDANTNKGDNYVQITSANGDGGGGRDIYVEYNKKGVGTGRQNYSVHCLTTALMVVGCTISAGNVVSFYLNGSSIASLATSGTTSLPSINLVRAVVNDDYPGGGGGYPDLYGQYIVAPRVLTAAEMLSVANTLLAL